REQDADIRGDALAAFEVEPDRKDVAEKSAEPGDQSRAIVNEIAREQNRGRAFQKIAEESRGGEFLAPGAQHVGCADIAGADRPHIAVTRERGEDQAEWNRAEHIAAYQRDEIRDD